MTSAIEKCTHVLLYDFFADFSVCLNMERIRFVFQPLHKHGKSLDASCRMSALLLFLFVSISIFYYIRQNYNPYTDLVRGFSHGD